MSARVSGRSKAAELRSAPRGRIDVARNQQKEARDLFRRRPATERDHPVARLVELLQRLLEKAVFEAGLILHHPLHRSLRERAKRHIGRRLRIDLAFLPEGAAKKIRRELKSDDLLAPVRQRLGEFDHAGQHVGVAVDLLRVADQFSAFDHPVLDRTLGQRRQLLGAERTADPAMPGFAGSAKHWDAGGVDILSQFYPVDRCTIGYTSILQRKRAVSVCPSLIRIIARRAGMT